MSRPLTILVFRYYGSSLRRADCALVFGCCAVRLDISLAEDSGTSFAFQYRGSLDRRYRLYAARLRLVGSGDALGANRFMDY